MRTIVELSGIQYNIDKANKTDGKVQNLAPYINKAALKAIHRQMKEKKAPGLDGMTKGEYDMNLDANLDALVAKMRRCEYYPNASLRKYIPKANGKMRPLGISCYEDKLVETNVAWILETIYEQKFMDFSYGFRPGRSTKDALKELIHHIEKDKAQYIVEADIRGFFDNVDHDWMMKFLVHDIADRKFLMYVERLLKAGAMEDGKYLDAEKGTPQGNGASPVLANVYLHYVLDTWFDWQVRQGVYGSNSYLVRFADDFVACFDSKWDALRFREELEARMRKFGLELAEEKTHVMEFGANAMAKHDAGRTGKPGTFDFLGFTLYCSHSRPDKDGKSWFRVKAKTCKKKFRAKVKDMKAWIMKNRNLPVKVLIGKLNQKLEGHYNYYGVIDNSAGLWSYLNEVKRLLYKWLNRRSQRRSYNYKQFNNLLQTYPLKVPAGRKLYSWYK